MNCDLVAKKGAQRSPGFEGQPAEVNCTFDEIFCLEYKVKRVRPVILWLKACLALAEDLGSDPSIHIVPHIIWYHTLENLMSSCDLYRCQVHIWYTQVQAGKAFAHIK